MTVESAGHCVAPQKAVVSAYCAIAHGAQGPIRRALDIVDGAKGPIVAHSNNHRGLWFPAFAGTTREDSNFQTASFDDTASRSRGLIHPRFAIKFPYPPIRALLTMLLWVLER